MSEKKTATELTLACFRFLPVGMRRQIFTGFSQLMYYLSPRQRLIALDNLKKAFPEKGMDDLIRIAKNAYRNLGIVASEFFELPSLTEQALNALVEVEGMEHCVKALEKNKGILVFGAHFGNWELQAVTISILMKPLVVIYRPLDSLFLDDLVARVRTSTGNIMIPKERAMRAMLRGLRNNELVGLLIDQNVAWQEGVFVDFFGRPACTTDGLALLALHTGAAVVPTFMARMPSGKYRLIIKEEVEVIRTENHEADVQANTQNFTRIIEDMIRQYPDQWLWVHHRWKTKASQVVRQK